MGGTVPGWLMSASVSLTLVVVMLGLGLGIVLREVLAEWRHPMPVARALFGVIVLMPLVAVAVARSLGLPREAEVGIVLMAIAPGAPVSLQRSLAAGGHRGFAPALQIAAALAAVVSMPVWVALLDRLYSSTATIEPWRVAWQVLLAQWAPLGAGIAWRRIDPVRAARLTAPVVRLGTVLLAVTVVLILVDAWTVTIEAGVRGVAAIVAVTAAGLAIGHLLGGREASARTAAAVTTAARNPGLALLVATRNDAPPGVSAAILACAIVSLIVLLPYTVWRGRRGRGMEPTEQGRCSLPPTERPP